jgi:hypothetical protein
MSACGMASASFGSGAGKIGDAPVLTAVEGAGRTPCPPPPQPATDSPMKATAAARTQSLTSDTYYSVLAPRDSNDEGVPRQARARRQARQFARCGNICLNSWRHRVLECVPVHGRRLETSRGGPPYEPPLAADKCSEWPDRGALGRVGASGISNQGGSPKKQIR